MLARSTTIVTIWSRPLNLKTHVGPSGASRFDTSRSPVIVCACAALTSVQGPFARGVAGGPVLADEDPEAPVEPETWVAVPPEARVPVPLELPRWDAGPDPPRPFVEVDDEPHPLRGEDAMHAATAARTPRLLRRGRFTKAPEDIRRRISAGLAEAAWVR